jgi:hypothetical protein
MGAHRSAMGRLQTLAHRSSYGIDCKQSLRRRLRAVERKCNSTKPLQAQHSLAKHNKRIDPPTASTARTEPLKESRNTYKSLIFSYTLSRITLKNEHLQWTHNVHPKA